VNPGSILRSAEAALGELLAQLPPEKSGAVAVVTDGRRVQAVIAARVGEHWEVAAAIKASATEKPSGMAVIRATW